MVGDVVGGPHKPIESQDRAAALALMSQDATGKFSSRWVFAGAGLARVGHARPASRIGA